MPIAGNGFSKLDRLGFYVAIFPFTAQARHPKALAFFSLRGKIKGKRSQVE